MRKRTDGVGIEVEVESKTPLPTDIGGVWLTHVDNSLRNYGMEYVCRQPIKIGPTKLGHIKTLTDRLNTMPSQLDMSHRTSVHVHRNVQGFTPVQVWTTILAYWLIEDPLINFCGPTRRGNLFCLPVSDCEGILHRCMTDLRNPIPFSCFPKSACKYGGQNLATISTLGSIEYRTMRGTTDPDIIDKWSDALWHLGERAKNFRDPAALMDFYVDSDKDELVYTLLPAPFANLVTSAPGYQGLIKNNALLLCDLAYAKDDWLAWQESLKSSFENQTYKGVLNNTSSSTINLNPVVFTTSGGTGPSDIEVLEELLP
jgi:hypothetical protein